MPVDVHVGELVGAVVEKLVFFFPDEEMTRQALGISRSAR